MIFVALISGGLVTNVIATDDQANSLDIAAVFSVDTVIDVTEYQPQRPAPGWSWDGFTFSPPPYPSWVLDENNNWQAPIPKPEEGNWKWDEEQGNWKEIVTE